MALLKTNAKSLALFVSSLVLLTTSAAQATYISMDELYGGDVANETSNYGKFNLANQNQSRAEFRYKSINTGTLNLAGSMKIDLWNKASESGTDSNRISILQVLNVEADNQPSGSSNPISQLTIRKKPTTANPDAMVFYIISGSGGQECSGAVEGSTYTLSVSVGLGGSPSYKINGTTCSHNPGDSDRAGRVGASDTGKYYYGKLGAYVTGGASNPDGASGNGVRLIWSSITDY